MAETDEVKDCVRVRMYRHGLGDCFLITIPDGNARAHVLIDCGVLKGTEDAAARMQEVAKDIRDTTGGRLDLLIVTHEHWDHVSGFLQAEAIFSKLAIGEVWLAWTERSDDELAQDLRQRKAKALRTIAAAAGQLRGMTAAAAQRNAKQLDGLLQFYGEALGVAGRKTTAMAMEWVKGRDGAVMQFLLPGQTWDVPGVKNVRAYVLGPPKRLDMLKRSRPSKRESEVYELTGDSGSDFGFFAAVDAQEGGGEDRQHPFEKWFKVSKEESVTHDFLSESYWNKDEWRRIEGDWLEAAGRLALHLDSDTNNTSLALAFELRKSGRVLLFPGDAQVGNWLSWEPLQWTVNDEKGSRTVSTGDLLARTVLYKVGHHGSHNATLRDKGLELMSSDELTAMIPVSRATAENMEWKMPFPSLFRRLEEKTKGRILDCDRGVPSTKPAALSETQWQRFVERTKGTTKDRLDYWIDL